MRSNHTSEEQDIINSIKTSKRGYEKPLIIDLEKVTYYLQRRSRATGEWRTLSLSVTGWTTAYQVLWKLRGKARREKKQVEYRVTSKREAEKYLEAWRDATHFVRYGEPRRRIA